MKCKKYWIVFLVLFISLQQYATFYAPGLTYDSRQYISAAHSFSERGIFLNQDGTYYVVQTPLYPVVLSMGIDHVLTWASLLNMISLGATLWIMFLLGEALIPHSISRWLYQGSLVFGTPLLLIGNFVWSEPLFLLLLSVIWYLLYQYYQHPSRQYIGWLIFLTNLLCLQRNAGIFFFLLVLLVILFKKQKWHIILYGILGSIGFMAWNVYVYQITSGSRNIADQAFFSGMARDYMAHMPILAAWFFPDKGGVPLFVILFVGAIAFTHHLYKRKKWEALQIKIMGWVLWISITYIAFIAAMWWELVLWDIERYLSVIYPLVMLGAFMVWDKLYAEIAGKKIKVFLVVFSWLWLCYPITRTVKNVVFWHEVNGKEKEAGTFFFEPGVNDGIHEPVHDTVRVKVLGKPLVAVAGEDIEINLNETVQLDASQSTDPEGQILLYLWQLMGKPIGSTVQLGATDLPVYYFQPDKPGTYGIRLKIVDADGLEAIDYVTITVK